MSTDNGATYTTEIAAFSNDNEFTGLSFGFYEIEIRDVEGCTNTVEIELEEVPQIVAGIREPQSLDCPNGNNAVLEAYDITSGDAITATAGASGGFIDYLVFPFTRGRIFNTIEKDDGQYNTPTKIFWASGAGFLTRKDIFKKVSGFDDNLFAHMEEIDYHWKCHLINCEVWVDPEAVLFHHGGKTLPMNSAKKLYLIPEIVKLILYACSIRLFFLF